ncbi:MAG: SEC-C domain-containing protein [Oscillospiraceae bacterium]|nr:SEC-C domain-containing protein [Oscillospiraceae bacterium]
MKIGRNEKCYCGSGKKYKRCCLNRDGVYLPENIAKSLFTQERVERNLDIVPSIIFKGHRMRAIWNKIYPRPVKETFNEFIISILLELFGEDWRASQMKLDEKERHVLIKWVYSNYELSKKAIESGIREVDENGIVRWGCFPSGEAQALMQLAYDAFCLQIVNRLPSFLVNRLKDKVAFQGVRYEIAVAAIIARAGFEINFLDDKIKSERHCEFIAKHKRTGIEIGVEAKSRRRPGVLNEPGEYDYDTEVRGDMWHLFRKARSQKPEDLPYIIFIDMNIRPTPDLSIEEKPWNQDIIKMVNDYGEATESNPDPYNALILTNFSYYYTGQNDTSSGEYFYVVSKVPQTALTDLSILDDIFESVHNYNIIPKEI